MAKVTKAVVLVAGLGTRFLPITKALPKEMLPLVDKPILQYIVEELVRAGIKDIIFVTNAYKKAIEDYFNPFYELEKNLEAKDKTKELEEVQKATNLANFIFIRQKQMGGNGDAILAAAPVIGNEPFVTCWGDDIILANPGWMEQIVAVYNKYQACTLTSLKVEDPEAGEKYGFADGQNVENNILKVSRLIEKPGYGKAPTTFGTFSGQVYTPDIFPALTQAKIEVGDSRELTYIDGLNLLLKEQKPIYAVQLQNYRYYDTGSKLGYLQAIVELALENPEIGPDFRKILNNLKS